MTKPIEVIMVLEELNIPYEIKTVRFEDIKKPPFIDLNPNGRAPAIKDPNTNLTLWESGAIVLYLIEHYDKEKKLTYESLQEKAILTQWLMFQMSGQGPYFGQCGWFNVLHSEKVPSAIERYNTEIRRILRVLDDTLSAEDNPIREFPNVDAWHSRVTARRTWKKCMEIRAGLMEELGLMSNGMPKGVGNMEEYQARIKKEESAVKAWAYCYRDES
ncbi:hypothetical protein SS1G_12248 [Sclerotinia sclerotiorum 1980 UF-70]|uniref:glutathione transferase n=2 Tax=Sclerotinia sclerotiorum (strain ATCC 18683 / 1980 / Ss-1) TaxID=665079 RepID=A0A1D9Q3B7_SCLS1|nr:hypothetical protein SS1G_12248 [Sclerotinia sclerotiorum 1980 UF-70]APA09444.1 hypothetical protein sscle_05g042140 [Sclerotinia sclerotiorum 1980 UF-70]EDN96042.1 hypothetical protein SS1G_12248 [Sclerotinia sclerotiorum 1980 UF-70]